MIICAHCSKAIIGTKYKSKGKKRYHNDCYNELINKAEETNKLKERSFKSNERESLIKYICSIYKIQKISYIIEKQRV
jgi:hypothetical protein